MLRIDVLNTRLIRTYYYPSVLQKLRALVAMNENLKGQEQEFKAHCRVSLRKLFRYVSVIVCVMLYKKLL